MTCGKKIRSERRLRGQSCHGHGRGGGPSQRDGGDRGGGHDDVRGGGGHDDGGSDGHDGVRGGNGHGGDDGSHQSGEGSFVWRFVLHRRQRLRRSPFPRIPPF